MKGFMCEHGGCMSKLSGVDLTYLLEQARKIDDSNDTIESTCFEDSAIFELTKDTYLFTTDFGPTIGNNPLISGKIAALNAISDIYVTGGIPLFALVTLILGKNVSLDISTDILKGIYLACSEENVKIVGGHTIVSEESIIGLSVIGKTNGASPKKKSSCSDNDWLYISKPIGTGLILRGFYHGLISQNDCDEAYNVLLQSNKIALKFSNNSAIHAMTDITGFGLLGHLCEMLGKNFGAVINLNAINFLSSLKLLNHNVMLTQHIKDNMYYSESEHHINLEEDSIYSLALFDPQTNGPILISADPSQNILLKKYGFTKIGEVKSNDTEILIINE